LLLRRLLARKEFERVSKKKLDHTWTYFNPRTQNKFESGQKYQQGFELKERDRDINVNYHQRNVD
jgi:hypothetical protein